MTPIHETIAPSVPPSPTRVSTALSLARSLERARVHALTLAAEATTISERALASHPLQPADAASIRGTLASMAQARELLELALTLEPAAVSL